MKPTVSIHEFAGVMLQMESTPCVDSTHLRTVYSVRAIGADYKPCGPDLTNLLDNLIAETGAFVGEDIIEMAPILSILIGEIENVK